MRYGACHEYVCRKCFAAESPAYHAITPPETIGQRTCRRSSPTEARGNPANKIDGDTLLREGNTWF